jgi:hypothetical protein
MFLRLSFGRSLTCPSGKPLRLSSKITGAAAVPCASAAPMAEPIEKGKAAMNFAAAALHERNDPFSHGSR